MKWVHINDFGVFGMSPDVEFRCGTRQIGPDVQICHQKFIFSKKHEFPQKARKIHIKTQKVKILKNVKIDPKASKMLVNHQKSILNLISSPNPPIKIQTISGKNPGFFTLT